MSKINVGEKKVSKKVSKKGAVGYQDTHTPLSRSMVATIYPDGPGPDLVKALVESDVWYRDSADDGLEQQVLRTAPDESGKFVVYMIIDEPATKSHQGIIGYASWLWFPEDEVGPAAFVSLGSGRFCKVQKFKNGKDGEVMTFGTIRGVKVLGLLASFHRSLVDVPVVEMPAQDGDVVPVELFGQSLESVPAVAEAATVVEPVATEVIAEPVAVAEPPVMVA